MAYVEPFGVPAGLVGRVTNGMTTMGYTAQAPAVYWNRKSQGYSDDLAAASTLAWANRTASSEPYRVANATTNGNALHDDRFTGRVRRITRADACPFCVMIADRGYIPSHAGFEAHAHCRCTPEPQISSYATSKSAIARGRAATDQDARRQAAIARREAEYQRVWAREGGIDGIPLRGYDDYVMQTFKGREQTLNALRMSLDGIRPEIIDRLGSINVTADPYFQTSDALAYYQNNGRYISIRPSEYRPGSTKAMQDTIDHKWWTPDGKTTGAERTLTHELGHFLDYQLDPAQQAELRGKLSDDWGIENMTDAKSIISEYGGKSDREAIAELWAEYKTSTNPRGPAKFAGQYIEDKLGPNPTPTPTLEEQKRARYQKMGWLPKAA
jgi:hypothetical protein